MNIAYEMMNKWGYEVIDQIVWVKLKDSKVIIKFKILLYFSIFEFK